MSKKPSRFGIGLYTPGEAARLVAVPQRAVERWTFDRTDGRRVFSPQLGDERVLTFADLVQLRSIKVLRSIYGLSLPRVREAIRVASDEYHVSFPLARRYRFAVIEGAIVLEIGEKLIGLTGRDKHQLFTKHVLTPYLDDLAFGRDGLASRMLLGQAGRYRLEIDPAKRFGQPLIMPGAIVADELARAVVTEGSTAAAAESFGVDAEAVGLAWRHYESTLRIAA